MTGTSKKKDTILDGLKDLLGGEDKKADTKPTVKKPTATAKSTSRTTKTTPKAGSAKKALDEKRAKIQAEETLKKQEEVLHSKTHQDLINAAYKAAEELGIAPWVLLRAAGWGHFTDDRGKKYDGPAIDKIEGLDETQKKALKKVLGL